MQLQLQGGGLVVIPLEKVAVLLSRECTELHSQPSSKFSTKITRRDSRGVQLAGEVKKKSQVIKL